MRTLLVAALLGLAGTTGALAYCASVPDDASSRYVENQAALTLCRQQEIADRVEAQQQLAQIQAQIDQLNMQIRLNAQFSRAQQAMPQF